MGTEWMRHRRVIAAYYRSANAYSDLCRKQYLSSVGMNTVEVQVIEHIIEHASENRNMKWFARQLGVSTTAFTNCVNGLVKKGLVKKYHTSDNKKNVILQVTEDGLAAYKEYSVAIRPRFDPLFQAMDGLPPETIDKLAELLNIWAEQHLIGNEPAANFTLIPVEDPPEK